MHPFHDGAMSPIRGEQMTRNTMDSKQLFEVWCIKSKVAGVIICQLLFMKVLLYSAKGNTKD